MLKTATLTIAIGAISALVALPASALPLAPLAQQDGAASILTLVADGCGRGNIRIKGECYREVKQEDDDQPRSRKRARSNDDEDDDQPRKHSRRNADNDDDHECRKGFHFSERRGRCVENPSAGEVLLKAIIGSGNNQHKGNSQGKAGNKGACKPESGCACKHGHLVCH